MAEPEPYEECPPTMPMAEMTSAAASDSVTNPRHSLTIPFKFTSMEYGDDENKNGELFLAWLDGIAIERQHQWARLLQYMLKEIADMDLIHKDCASTVAMLGTPEIGRACHRIQAIFNHALDEELMFFNNSRHVEWNKSEGLIVAARPPQYHLPVDFRLMGINHGHQGSEGGFCPEAWQLEGKTVPLVEGFESLTVDNKIQPPDPTLSSTIICRRPSSSLGVFDPQTPVITVQVSPSLIISTVKPVYLKSSLVQLRLAGQEAVSANTLYENLMNRTTFNIYGPLLKPQMSDSAREYYNNVTRESAPAELLVIFSYWMTRGFISRGSRENIRQNKQLQEIVDAENLGQEGAEDSEDSGYNSTGPPPLVGDSGSDDEETFRDAWSSQKLTIE
ncbi:hypothetical protein P7C70_g6410, partial [Phenoliferia sp. Uapishka_3]